MSIVNALKTNDEQGREMYDTRPSELKRKRD